MNGALLRAALACLALWLGGAPGFAADPLLDRGAYLVEGIGNCGNCHAPQEPSGALPLAPLSGGPAITTPAFAAYPPNITPDKATGIGSWTEDQLVTALRDGRTPDGRMLRPPMPTPFYRTMSDDDAHAIAAYVLSRPAVANTVPVSQYRVPTPPGYGPPVGHVTAPPPADKVAYGGYLASMGHCMLCHTPVGRDGQRDYAHLQGSGGLLMQGPFGRVVTPNITPDQATGIGCWSDADILHMLTTGQRPDGRRLGPPMPALYLARLTPEDDAALLAWLRALPPIHHPVDR